MLHKQAKEIVQAIHDELYDRKGFDDWWDSLDEDITKEITDACVKAVMKSYHEEE